MADFALSMTELSSCTRNHRPAKPKIFTIRSFIDRAWFAGPWYVILIYKKVKVKQIDLFKKQYAETSGVWEMADTSGMWEMVCLSKEIVSNIPWAVIVKGFFYNTFFYYCEVTLVGLSVAGYVTG